MNSRIHRVVVVVLLIGLAGIGSLYIDLFV
jgi:hypothetical protein